jgi:ubiquinone/menaquinone biosynthesis C-methylase UbiE
MNNTQNLNKKIINGAAYQRIIPFLKSPYQLNSEGEDFVILSNENLPESYFEHLLFPVSNFWSSYFEDKLNLLKPVNRGVMLDVCCGTGTLCLNVMPKLGFKKCIAIDNSEVAIELLRERVKSDQNIEVVKQDITKTSFESNSIDAVYGNSFLHHIPDNYRFLSEVFRVLNKQGVMVLTGEPTIGAPFLENSFMMTIIKVLVFLRLKKKWTFLHETPVTDIWLYEEDSLRKMLTEIGFTDITIQSFGFLVPLLNWPTALVLQKLTGKSLQPELYWKWLSWLDKKLFSWVPANKKSHFVIAARKPN